MQKNEFSVADTETSALDGEILEIAVITFQGREKISEKSELFKPKGKMTFGAMGVNHITPEMVEDKDHWDNVKTDWLPDSEYLVAHNAKFDVNMIGSEVTEKYKVICTLELARKFISKDDCDSHSNMSLYYYLGLNKKYKKWPKGDAHRALYDAEITSRVFLEMLERFDLSLEEAYSKSQPEFICYFNKHRDKLWVQVVKEDPDYVQWLLDNNKFMYPEDAKKVKGLMDARA